MPIQRSHSPSTATDKANQKSCRFHPYSPALLSSTPERPHLNPSKLPQSGSPCSAQTVNGISLEKYERPNSFANAYLPRYHRLDCTQLTENIIPLSALKSTRPHVQPTWSDDPLKDDPEMYIEKYENSTIPEDTCFFKYHNPESLHPSISKYESWKDEEEVKFFEDYMAISSQHRVEIPEASNMPQMNLVGVQLEPWLSRHREEELFYPSGNTVVDLVVENPINQDLSPHVIHTGIPTDKCDERKHINKILECMPAEQCKGKIIEFGMKDANGNLLPISFASCLAGTAMLARPDDFITGECGVFQFSLDGISFPSCQIIAFATEEDDGLRKMTKAHAAYLIANQYFLQMQAIKGRNVNKVEFEFCQMKMTDIRQDEETRIWHPTIVIGMTI